MKQIIINCGLIQNRAVVVENGSIVDVLVEHSDSSGGVNNIYKGVVANVVPGMQCAFVDIGLEKNAFLFAGDYGEEDIRKLVKQGQEVIVQVTKEAQGVKGAKVTTEISLPGHRLVLLSGANYVCVSKKITGGDRERLQMTVEKIAVSVTDYADIDFSSVGYIVRTDALGSTDEELKSEIEYLNGLWSGIYKNGKIKKAPCLLYDANGMFLTVIRDYSDESVDEIIVNDKAAYERLCQIAQVFVPKSVKKIKYKEGNLFLSFESKLKKLLQRRVWLDCGGYLIIDTTEALTVIDVNTGKFTGDYDLQRTILRTNIEAAKEIARQLRLRAIGGIIVVDFIDMETDEEREQVLEALRAAGEGDKVKTNILGFAPLGLVELTRKKTRLSLSDCMQAVCPYCEGDGKILNDVTVADNIFRELKRLSGANDSPIAVIRLNPYMIEALRRYPDALNSFEKIEIFVRPDGGLHIEDFNISMLSKISEQEGLIKLK